MTGPRVIVGLLAVACAACASMPDGPSLAPRAAEAVDPRLPVPDRSAELPGDQQFAASVTRLRDAARAAAARAEPSLAAASAAAAAAGARESESWIAAQQALSAAVAERAAFTRAVADLDALVAARVRSGGRFVVQDLAVAEAASAELAVIDRRQSAEIARLEARLR